MDERTACAQLKSRFEAAGFGISENFAFDEGGIAFEMDGFDAEARVGYEYVSEEAGDTWDVTEEVIAALDAREDVHVLLVVEADAPDAAALDAVIDTFLASLGVRGGELAGDGDDGDEGDELAGDGDVPDSDVPDGDVPDSDVSDSDVSDSDVSDGDADVIESPSEVSTKRAAKKATKSTKKPTKAAKKPAAKKPAAKKPAAKKPAAKKPAAKKSAKKKSK